MHWSSSCIPISHVTNISIIYSFSEFACAIYIGLGKLLFFWSVKALWGVLVDTISLCAVHSRRLEQYVRTAAHNGCKVHRTYGKGVKTWIALVLWMGKATFQLCFGKVLKLFLGLKHVNALQKLGRSWLIEKFRTDLSALSDWCFEVGYSNGAPEYENWMLFTFNFLRFLP